MENVLIMDYNADFRYDLEWGQMGEQVVADIVAGDKTEVKSERDMWVRTGNHFVETESRGKPSGICTTQAKYWSVNFFQNDKFMFNLTLTVENMKAIVYENRKKKVSGGDDNTSRGVLVPIKDLIQVWDYL